MPFLVPPEGPALAIILFTDLVGSTAMRAALGEEAADQLRRQHDQLLTAEVHAQRGVVVKGSGDGVMAAFASATDALNAAVTAQQALWRYNQTAPAGAELAVRMGLSVGDVSWEDGDCFGAPVVEAARLEALAEGGTILCADLVRVLARGRGSHRFLERGLLELRGLPEPMLAWEVCWDPPLATHAGTLSLPAALSLANEARFVGRQDVLQRAVDHLGNIERLKVLWINGEAGIGKTRTAAAVADRAAAGGALVLFGRCDEDMAYPFQPIAEALRQFVAIAPDIATMGADPTMLARLAPAITALADAGEVTPAPGADQPRLFDAVVSWLDMLSGTRPVMLVIDDVHWANASTVQLLRFVVDTVPSARLALVFTSRSTEAYGAAVQGLHDELLVRASTLGVELHGLGTDAIGELVGADEAAALELFDQTGGNPLFLTLLSGSGADIGAAVRRRTRALSSQARALLSMAAVSGTEWELAIVAGALGRPVVTLLDPVQELRRAGLIGELGVGRFRFGHVLVRQALLAEAGVTAVAAAHLHLADAIEVVHRLGLDAVAEALAHHLVEALAVGADPQRTADALQRAGRQARYQFDHESAVAHFSEARRLLSQTGLSHTRAYVEAALGEGEARVRTTDLSGGFERLTETLELADAGGWPDLAVPAVIQYSKMSAWMGRSGDAVVALLERVLAHLPPGDSAERSLVATELARSLSPTAQHERAGPVIVQAEEMARRCGDEAAELMALSTHFHVYFRPQDRSICHRALRRAVEMETNTAAMDPFAPISGLQMRVDLEQGNLTAAKGRLATFERIALHYRFYEVELSNCWAMVHMAEGDFARAEACYERGRQVAASMTGFDVEGIYGLQMFLLRREQGRLQEVAAAVRLAARLGVVGAAWQPGLAAVCAELGLHDEARAVLDRVVGPRAVGPGMVAVGDDSLRGASLSLLADAASVVGTPAQADALLQMLEPWADICIMVGSLNGCIGPADRFRGALAARTGDVALAEACFQRCLKLAQRSGSPLWTVQAALAYGEFLSGAGEGRSDEAAALLGQAHQLAHRFDFGRARSRLETLGWR
ncbi:MAG: ATP-binding protein [Acidimicrobiales bacterium]